MGRSVTSVRGVGGKEERHTCQKKKVEGRGDGKWLKIEKIDRNGYVLIVMR